MTKASYLITFISLIIALGISDLILSLHRLLRVRNQIKWHWLPLIWTATIFLSLIQIWYGIYHYMDFVLTATSAGFVVILLPVIFQIMMALAVLPEGSIKPGFDLKEWYFAQKNYLLVLMLLNLWSFSIVKVIQAEFFDPFAVVGILTIPIVVLLRSKNVWVHTILSVTFFLLFLILNITQQMYLK